MAWLEIRHYFQVCAFKDETMGICVYIQLILRMVTNVYAVAMNYYMY